MTPTSQPDPAIERAQARPPVAPRERETAEVHREAKEQRVDLALQSLSEKVTTEKTENWGEEMKENFERNIQDVANLDITKDKRDQIESAATFTFVAGWGVLGSYFAHLAAQHKDEKGQFKIGEITAAADADKEPLKNLSTALPLLSKVPLDRLEGKALEKMNAIQQQPAAGFGKEFNDTYWPKMVDALSKSYKKSLEEANRVKQEEPPKDLWGKIKDAVAKGWEWTKEHKNDIIKYGAIAAAIGGAIWLAKTLFGSSKKEGEKAEEGGGTSWWKWALGALGIGSIGTYLTSKLLGQDLLGGVSEKMTQTMEQIGQKIDFSKRKEEFLGFMQQHHIETPDWMKNLRLDDLVNTLGLDKLKDADWTDYVGMAGFAALIYKFMGVKGIAVNAGMFFLLVNKGKDSVGGKLITGVAGAIDSVKNSMIERAKGSEMLKFVLPEILEKFSLEEKAEGFLDLIQEHPYISMGVMNGAWLLKGFIWKIIKGIMTGTLKAAAWGINNPKALLALTAGAAFAVVERRKIVRELADLFFEDAGERSKFIETAGSILRTDMNAPETYAEKDTWDVAQSLLEDPVAALEKGGEALKSAWDKGLLAFSVDAMGGIWLFVKGTTVPYQLAKLSWVQFKSMFHAFKGDNPDGYMVPIVIGGSTSYVFTKMTVESLRAYGAVYDAGNEGFTGFMRVMKAILPGSKEWRFIFKSSLMGLPGAKTAWQKVFSLRIPKIENGLQELTAAVKRGADAGELERLALRVRKLIGHLQTAEEIDKDLSVTATTRAMYERLGVSTVRSHLDTLITNARGGTLNNEQALRTLADAKEKIRTGASGLSDEISRATDFWQKMKDAGTSKLENTSEWIRKLFQGTETGVDVADDLVEGTESGARAATATEHADDAVRTGAQATEAVSESGEVLSQSGITLKNVNNLKNLRGDQLTTALKEMGVSVDKVDDLARTIEESKSLNAIAGALEKAGVEIGPGIKGLIKIGHYAPPVAVGLAAAANAYATYQAYAVAQEVKNNAELKEVLMDKTFVVGIASGSQLLLDVGSIAGWQVAKTAGTTLGVEVAGATVGAAALPLMVIIESAKYMVSGSLDAIAETKMQANDYTKLPKEQLLHLWYTTGYDTSAGEAYDSFFTSTTQEGYMEERTKTRRKIVEAIFLQEGAEKPEEYNKYRMRYVEQRVFEYAAGSFAEGQEMITLSRTFANIMTNRNQTMTVHGQTMNLMDAQYDVDKITYPDILKIIKGIQDGTTDQLKQLLGTAGAERLTNLNASYVNHAINVLMQYVLAHEAERGQHTPFFAEASQGRPASGHPAQRGDEFEKINQLTALLLTHLNTVHKTSFVMEQETNPADFDKVRAVFLGGSLSSREVKEQQGDYRPKTKGDAALFALAQYLGYQGDAKPDNLHLFFDEAHASVYGIYWNGTEWIVNEEGNRDDHCGNNGEETVLKIIKELRYDPEDVLASRYDKVVDNFNFVQTRDDVEKRTQQVLSMADLMEKAFRAFKA